MVTTSRLGKLQRKMRDDIFSLFTTSESKSQFRGLWRQRKKTFQQLTRSYSTLHRSTAVWLSLPSPHKQTTPSKPRALPWGSHTVDAGAGACKPEACEHVCQQSYQRLKLSPVWAWQQVRGWPTVRTWVSASLTSRDADTEYKPLEGYFSG